MKKPSIKEFGRRIRGGSNYNQEQCACQDLLGHLPDFIEPSGEREE